MATGLGSSASGTWATTIPLGPRIGAFKRPSFSPRPMSPLPQTTGTTITSTLSSSKMALCGNSKVIAPTCCLPRPRRGSKAAARTSSEPFFAYLLLNAVHAPLFVPDKYREPYPSQRSHNVASFFGMIANIDENMEKLDKFLVAEGLRENTILIFMTDNGGTFGVPIFNAGMRGQKTELYDGGHRVPCFVRWPSGKLRPHGDVAELTECQDILPTLIDLCTLKPPQGVQFDGASLAGLLRGEPNRLADRILTVQYSRYRKAAPKEERRLRSCGNGGALCGARSFTTFAPIRGRSKTLPPRTPPSLPVCSRTTMSGGPQWRRKSTSSAASR